MPLQQRLFEGDVNEGWGEITKKALYATTIGSVGAYLLFNETGDSQMLGIKLPAALTAGIGCGAGSMVGDFLTDKIVAQMDQSTEVKTAESMAVKLAVSGAGTVAALKFGSQIEPSMYGFALGAGSKFGADSVHASVDPLSAIW